MTDPTVADIKLPADLRPADGRFGSGPSKVRREALAALAATGSDYLGTNHRKPTVKSLVNRLRGGLAELLALPAGYEVALGNGGTSVFWDAAVLSVIDRRSQHLAFGEFSARFATLAAAAPHLEDPAVIEAPYGTHPQPAADPDVDTYALTHNETSTGVATSITRPEGATGLVIVDATSAAGGMRVEPTQFDVYYFAPQKCFASDGGLWVAACSPAAIERVERIAASDRWIPATLDVSVALENSRQDQTLNTPALATIFLFVHQLEWILGNGGLEWAARRCDRSAEILYGWAEASAFARPFVEKPDERSPVVGTIDVDDAIDANTVAAILRGNGILDTEGYRKLGRNQLRIAMYPAIDPDDVAALTASIDFVAERLG